MKKATVIATAVLVSAASLVHAQANPRVYTPQFENNIERSENDVPVVEIWLNDQSYRYGDVIRPYVATEPGAYLTVVRITTDGELKVLYPRVPSMQTRYSRASFSNDRVPHVGEAAYARESTGNGFVFAIASYYRFDYSYYSSSGHWSMARLANASRFGSPFQMLRSFVEEIMNGSTSYSMDYVMYDVNASSYRSRYANRYRGYAYNDYLDLCLDSFGAYWYSYCRGYNTYYNPRIVVRQPTTLETVRQKGMRVKPLIHDPVVAHGPAHNPVVEGRFPSDGASERAAIQRRERMLREARPGVEPRSIPMQEPRIHRPSSEPMTARPAPRTEPRPEPRIETRRVEPAPRIESRPQHRERPQKDN